MKNKKKLLFLIIISVFSFLFSLSLEYFYFNRDVRKDNKKYDVDIMQENSMIEKGDWYQSDYKYSYLILHTNTSYINKILFDYDADTDFKWSMEYFDANNNLQKIDQSSSSLIKKATRELNLSGVDEIKLSFYTKNIKVKNIVIDNRISFNYARIFFIFFSLFVLSVIIFFHKYFYRKLEKAFLFLAIIGGIFLLMVSPKLIYTSWDDQIHIKNAYTFLNKDTAKYSMAFTTLASKNKINKDYFQTKEEQFALYQSLNAIHKKTKNRVIQINNYGAKYNRLVYFPFYFGFRLADLLHISFTGSLILAKLMNLLAYIILMYFAIKLATYAKRIIFVIALLVSNIFLATNFSYDPTITASIVLAFSLYLRLLELEKINYKYLLAFILSIIWACLPKAIYCPILLLLLFLPKDKFRSKKEAILIKSTVVFITLLLLSTFVLPFLLGSVAGDIRGGNTDASGQLYFILHHPFQYAKILIRYFVFNVVKLFIGSGSLVGTCYLFDFVDIENVEQSLYAISLIYLFYTVYTSDIDKKVITIKMKILFGVLILGLWALISTALYISICEVGNSNISGVQPRYFISLILPLLLILSKTRTRKEKTKFGSLEQIVFLCVPFFLLMSVSMFLIYYGRGF